jgi:6-phosphogluconolactonase (cycloisomerase 2 family)
MLSPLGFLAGLPSTAEAKELSAKEISGKLYLYSGSWGHMEGSDGIHAYEFDTQKGKLKHIKQISDSIRCGQTCVDLEGGYFYCEDERTPHLDFGGDNPDDPKSGKGGGGNLFSFAVDRKTGLLEQIGKTYSYGPQPSFLCLTKEKDYMLCTLYGGKTCVTRAIRTADGKFHIVTVPNLAATQLFKMNPDHTIGELVDSYEHYSRSIENNEKKQHFSNAHCVTMSPDGKLFATCDKGGSTITFFVIDRKYHKLKVSAATYDQPNNEGARYCLFHQTQPFFYVNNEKNASVNTFKYDKYGNLELLQTVCPLPAEMVDDKLNVKKIPEGGKFEQQDFKMHPNGKYIYNMMRCAKGRTSEWEGTAVFEIDESTGLLKLKQFKTFDCLWPRGCNVSPDGKWFLVAAMYSDEILIMPIKSDGTLGDITSRVKNNTVANLTWFPEIYQAA